MSTMSTTGKDLQVAEQTIPGAGDIEGGSPNAPPVQETSSRNTGDSVMEFNVISFCTPQGKQILHDIGKSSRPPWAVFALKGVLGLGNLSPDKPLAYTPYH